MLSTDLRPSREGNFVGALAQSVILAWDWRRRAIAFVAGALGALALPPFDFLPAMLAPMLAAVWLIDGSAVVGASGRSTGRSVRSAFAAGWWWGFGYFVAGLWWLGAAFLVEADKFAWALPLGVLALPAGLAFFPALGFAIARLLWSPGAGRIFALAVGLCASEWLRAVVLTGFPWNEIGMALGQNQILAQFASIVGLHGLTILTIAIFAAPATLADERRGRWFFRPILLAFAALGLLAVFGGFRLSAPDAALVAGVKLRIMQPNVAQDADFRPQNKDAIMRRYLALSDRATSPTSTGVADISHLIWPESAFPFLLARDPQALEQIADLLHGGAILITGAARVAERIPGDGRAHYFNSIQVIDSHGALLDRYDKQHLVPFGEYLPFADFFDRFGVTQFIHFPGGFDAGSGPGVLHAPGLPDALPLICYEAVFPQEIGSIFHPDERRASWMLNVTDDAWFGVTPGPHQHFAQARLRAIEQGLPLVRAANTGVSAVVDGLGRVIAALPLGVEGVLDSPLPAPAPPTFYARFGALAPLAIWVVFLFLSVLLKRKLRR
ncbi:apolipoprotein N-acyltransferase [Methylocapsa sp. S129]|uniref:apolipoprotein N-acyltransferase n=1 Tax=Methylocapsa sp. S129 TaxID=1641869 RepID=UPI001FEFADF4|nr:apolipoprotein N-acyltransferase [Methylocapsa sp. S129]